MKNYLRMLSYYLTGKKVLACFILLILLAETLVFLSFQVAYKEIFDGIATHEELKIIFLWIGVVFIASVLRILFLILDDYFMGKLTIHIFNQLRMKLYAHLQWLSAGFYQRTHMSTMVSGYSHDLQASETTTRQALPLFITNLMTLFFSIVLLFYFEWRLTLVVIALLPLLLVGSFFFVKPAKEITKRNQLANSKLFSMMEEVAAQHMILQAFNLQDNFYKKFKQRLTQYSHDFMKGVFLRALIGRSSIFGLLLAEVIIFGAGALMAYHSLISIGTLFIFFSCVWNITGAIFTLSIRLPDLIGAGVGLSRLQELLNEKTEEPLNNNDHGKKNPMSPLTEGIEFRDVSLGYERQSALKNISLKIPVGSSVAFMGSTGSGKTSILSLLLGLYQPTEGELLFDEKEIREIDAGALRSEVGVVFQHNPLFNMSLRENIRVGRWDATDEEVMEAAKNAEIHDFILSLPDGYDTLVKEYGSNLSGGQKQRIAIARLFLRAPSILLLDEHTSALDPITEYQVNETILKLAAGRTVIISTHRIDITMHVDKIYIVHKGEIVEGGSHVELMEERGRYYNLWHKQHGIALGGEGRKARVSVQFLRELSFFKTTNEGLLKEIADQFLVEWVDEGSVVFEKGSYGDKFYIILRGSVEVRNPDKLPENPLIATLEEGDYFGEIALLKNVKRTSQIVASAYCILLTLHASQFQAIVSKDPEMRQGFEEAFGHYFS